MGRSNKNIELVTILMSTLVILCLQLCHVSESRNQPAHYIVGDDVDGWSPLASMEPWPQGKTFYAGDVLEFKYDPDDGTNINVLETNQTGHDECKWMDPGISHNSGDDKITLKFGPNYFICYGDYCPAGMKMAIDAKQPPP